MAWNPTGETKTDPAGLFRQECPPAVHCRCVLAQLLLEQTRRSDRLVSRATADHLVSVLGMKCSRLQEGRFPSIRSCDDRTTCPKAMGTSSKQRSVGN